MALLWLLIALGALSSSLGDEESLVRTRRGTRMYREYCKDWLSTEVHQHGETWLRWHGRSVEYCRCANRKSRCHAVPVEECSRSRCYNGGSCKQALHSPEFICSCPSGFVGPQCEIDTTEKCVSGRGGGYRGTWGQSRSSIDCLNWNSSVLIDKKYNARRNDALQLGLGNHNYCRNPDNDTEPWCHVYKNKQLVWEYCSVPSCPQGGSAECYAGIGSSYRGSRSSTHTGARCLSWDSPALAKKAYNAWRVDARQLGLGSHNHCRNPDNDSKPWCHVYRGRALTWEHCDLPKCVDRPVSSSTVGSSGFLSGHDNAVESCGKRLPPVSQYRIKGGQVSSIAAHPWQAALFVYNRQAHADSYFCGGVLIGSCWLLSAAHCFQERFRPNLLKVVMGRTYRLQNSTNEQIFRVEKYFVHEQYDEETFDNDIVLLKLTSDTGACALETSFVRPVCLPDPGLSLPDWSQCEISGYGKEEEFSAFYSERLKEGHVRLWPSRLCTPERLSDRLVTENMLCAGDTRGLDDACKGDSGGPLVCSSGGRMNLIGIISWGDGCGKKDTPGVYTRVSKYLGWIQSKISQETR
ncbi:tissue-type plasminogen activator [Huso huso]|uniref:Plasminogen activator n=1 Tax=Huso huso TaxID=61971 RepID=A0ABR0Y7T2_HUSHU